MFETAMFLEAMEKLVKRAYKNAESKGYWEEGEKEYDIVTERDDEGCVNDTDVVLVKTKPWNFGEKIALLHSELTEMLEAHRKGNPPCAKTYPSPFDGKPITIGVMEGGGVRTITAVEEECADVVIRLMSLCGKLGIDLGRVILAKMEYNESPVSPKKAY